MIILIGVAGAGKSVQGKLLAKDLGATWVSTGELLRQNISGDRREDMLRGKLLDDKEIISVISEFLHRGDAKNCILDGFPRTITQAQWLLNDKSITDKLKAVIHLKADKKIVKERLLTRGRLDDNEHAIDLRFKEYEAETLPIIDLFKDNGIQIYEINGERHISEVHREIMNKLTTP